MHSVSSHQHSYPAHRSTMSGHDIRSVCSEGAQMLSDDPHERYHPVHKELYDLGMSSDRSTREGRASTTGRSSRFSISSDRPFAVVGVDDVQASLSLREDMDERCDFLNPPRHPPSTHKVEEDTSYCRNDYKNTVIPELIERASWSEFMNKTEDKPEFAIEVLTTAPEYYKGFADATDDTIDLASRPEIARKGSSPAVKPRNTALKAHRNDKLRPVPNDNAPKSSIPDRIRINSSSVLRFLSRMDSTIDPTEPTVILRPYKLLVDNETEIKKNIGSLHHDIGAQTVHSGISDDSASHLLCLLRFMDDYICPTLRQLDNNATKKINFRDLWYIFQPGVDICIPLRITQDAMTTEKKNITPQVFRNRYQMFWRVCGVGGGRPCLSDTEERYDNTGIKWSPFSVNAYYIDFDGRYFVPIHHTYFIQPFEGEKDITNLDFYPTRFSEEGQHLVREHAIFDEQIFRALTEGHMAFYYSGYTMLAHPCGCPISDQAMHQETIDSEVIIDTRAALLEHPPWQPQVSKWKNPPVHADELDERHTINTWSASSERSLLRSAQEYIYNDYEVDFRRACFFRDTTEIFRPVPSAWLSNAQMVPERDYHIFSGRVFGFVLRTRTFAPLWVWDLKQMRQQRESLSNLQLHDNSSKDILVTLVERHYYQTENNPDFEYDVIRGKCKGLIMLLHGVAGTGKTSTAESIAAALGKPLFQITCGDLGTQPNEVEKGLKQIFRFAQQWGCVLLLDECEIFLSRRTRNDLTHNALVSVFLRTLELYTGVLFLTTNRVGVLDDAIKSRLTWTSYYPPLDSAQTSKIWQTHMRMLKERRPDIAMDEDSILKFANRHFGDASKRDCAWNGREIQNAFKVAVSLAEKEAVRDGETNSDLYGISEGLKRHRHRPKLRAKHFKLVAKNTGRFDKYFHEATGNTERERAYNSMERADDWQSEETDSDPSQYKRERNRVSLDAGTGSWKEDASHLGGKSVNIPKRAKDSYDVVGTSPSGFGSLPKGATALNRQKFHSASRIPDRRRSSASYSNGFLPVSTHEHTNSREQGFDDMDDSSNSEDGSD